MCFSAGWIASFQAERTGELFSAISVLPRGTKGIIMLSKTSKYFF